MTGQKPHRPQLIEGSCGPLSPTTTLITVGRFIVVSSATVTKHNTVEFPNLEELDLSMMYTLDVIMHGQIPDQPLCKFREIEVRKCNNLLKIIPSNFERSLGNLDMLSIDECASQLEVF